MQEWGLRQAVSYWIGVAVLSTLGFLIDDSYILHILILCFIWAIVVTGWDLVLGYAGIFNYAQLVFFAIGAYGAGMLSAKAGVDPLMAIMLGGVITGLFGLIIALPCLRLRGEYIALFTFAIHLAMPALILKTKSWGTGGNMGLLGIPSIDVMGLQFTPIDKQYWYFFALIIASIVIYLVYFVVLQKRMGHALESLRDSDEFACSLGVNQFGYKLLAFFVSALVTGIAGALYAHYTSVVTPRILGNEFFLLAMVMMAIGGIGRFPGVIIGAFIVTIANELLRETGNFRLLILGIAVVLTVLVLPKGIVSLYDRWIKRNIFQ